MMNAVDLFAGCGGLSLGFQNAGINIKAAFEFWNVAANCYEKNFNHPVHRVDLSDTGTAIKLIESYSPDIIIGGPPCQDFSFAGKRIEAARASLTGSYADIICSIKPKYFVMENVDRAAKSNAYSEARKKYKENGYGLTEIILDASKCGVPQKRKRFFCIGILDGFDDAVKNIINSKISKEPTTIRDYYGNTLGFEFYYRHPRNYSRRAIFSIDEPAPTMRGVNRPVPKGYPGHPNDACKLSPSVRALTTAERALIQTFPKDFIWIGNKTDTEQMIGNAVPVKLAEFVASSICEYIKSQDIPTVDCIWNMDEFETWLIEVKKYSRRTARDVISRCKRSDKIYHCENHFDAYYLFMLQQQTEYQQLSSSVKSQLKRAITLQLEYNTFQNTNNIVRPKVASQ
ncbi:MAG: DNA cytosine methyltransferase [Butyrivibrio sp.]|nr:DNA cytosine methyltransferase [Butyrivibrio sp.]